MYQVIVVQHDATMYQVQVHQDTTYESGTSTSGYNYVAGTSTGYNYVSADSTPEYNYESGTSSRYKYVSCTSFK